MIDWDNLTDSKKQELERVCEKADSIVSWYDEGVINPDSTEKVRELFTELRVALFMVKNDKTKN